jgi:hypothetical protein
MTRRMRSKFAVAGMLITAVLVLSAAALRKTDDHSEFLEKRAALVVRQIGHKLLLHAGDHRSRIPPVTQLSDAIFQLEFQNTFSFMPDTLVTIARRELSAFDLPLNYMVNVFACATGEVVYGFEIRPEKKTDIVPCLGREQPRGCYTIQIAFLDLSKEDDLLPRYLLSFIVITGIALFAFIGGAFGKIETPEEPVTGSDHAIAIGKFLFDADRNLLRYGAETIALSDKETKLLGIFAASQNQLIDRNRLLAEVWESEGVFTGRSLDMFVSKLRKKLSIDTSIRIANIHGRGYKLEVNDPEGLKPGTGKTWESTDTDQL